LFSKSLFFLVQKGLSKKYSKEKIPKKRKDMERYSFGMYQF